MKLEDYLKKRQMTVSQFGRLAGIPIPTVWRILHKPGLLPTMATVARIVRATKGRVRASDFLPEVGGKKK